MRTLITIMAHKEAQETFNRHYPTWYGLGGDLYIVYPAQSRVLIPTVKGGEQRNVMQLEIAKAAHSGVESIIRFRTILEQMHGMTYDRYVFFEYDALCFGKLPENFGDIAGIVYRDNGPDRGFEGTMFVHPPLMFTHKGIEAVVKVMQKMPLMAERGIWDRWLGLALERAGLPVHNFMDHGQGLSRNTWHDSELPELKAAARRGVSLYHGIKSAEAFNICVEGARLWANKQELIKEGMI